MKQLIILIAIILMPIGVEAGWFKSSWQKVDGVKTVSSDIKIKDNDLVFDMVEGPLNATGLMGIADNGGGAGTLLDSTTYCYNMTYVTATGETAVINRTDTSASNPTSITTTIGTGSDDHTITLSTIPVSTDSRVTSKNIYRAVCTGATNGNVLLNLIANIANATTSYADTGDTEGAGISMHNTTGGQVWMIDGTTLMMEASGKLTSFGLNAGVNNSGLDNTFFGWRAGEGSGGGVSYGKANVFIGDGAGMKYTSGQTNTFVGHASGREATTASGNTCSGSHSCDILVNGNNNTVGGVNAFSFADGGSNNTIYGANTGLGFEGAVGNIIIGFDMCKTAANCGGVDAEGIFALDNNDTDDPLLGGHLGNNVFYIGGKVVQKMNYQAQSGAHTLTAAQFLQYGINHTANGNALTLPTVTDVVALLPFCVDGATGHQLKVRSIGAGNSTLTVDGSAEWTLDGTDFVIGAGNTAIFDAIIDNCTTEAGTIYKISEQVH